MSGADQSVIEEYFSSVLGVRNVLLPEPNLAPAPSLESSPKLNPVPESAEADEPVVMQEVATDSQEPKGAGTVISKHERSASELIMFVETDCTAGSFFDTESSELLEKMIAAMKVDRSQVSKVQLSGEITEIALLENKGYVVFMGAPQDRALGHTFGELGGQWLGCGLLTLHPSYLLKNPEAKKQTWNDLKRVMRELSKK